LPADTNQIESLTVEQAKKLVKEFPGVTVELQLKGFGPVKLENCLPLNGITKLTPDVAQALAGYSRGPLYLNGLTTLSAEAAKALAQHKGLLFLDGLTTLSAEAATALAQHKHALLLDGLTTLSAEAAKALAQHKGDLSLGGLTTLSAEAAKALAQHEDQLYLNGLTTLSAEAAKALAQHKGQSAREAARRTEMQNNVRQVMMAMLIHESAKRRLPAQAICDKDGKPLLSWRVAVLPFLEEGALYEQFRLDEPWDSEHNLKLLERMPAVYGNPSAPDEAARGLTTIQVFTGRGTPFPAPGQALDAGDIQDGMSNTLAIVEASPDQAVPWTKPDDLEFDPEQPLAGVGNPRRPGGLFITGFFDSHTATIMPDEIDPEVFKAVVTPAGGEPVSLD
jgi:hypothetical protein